MLRTLSATAILIAGLRGLAAAQVPRLLADVNAELLPARPSVFLAVDSTAYFGAFAGGLGRELWATDGRPGGTRLVVDLCPGLCGGEPSSLIWTGTTLFFTAGSDLWETDGTAPGTRPVWSETSSTRPYFPLGMVLLDGRLVFSARDASGDEELWACDGTESGTYRIADIQPGAASSRPGQLTVAGDRLFFTADDGVRGRELWVSDGTEAGTVLVADLAPGVAGSVLSSLTALGSDLLFVAGGVNGEELWRSDGQASGTGELRDILPGPGSSSPSGLTLWNGRVYFSAEDGARGRELWSSDGTAAGTALVGDIAPGLRSSFPTVIGTGLGQLFLAATTTGEGTELWQTDGTSAGTRLFADLDPGPPSSSPGNLVETAGALFFTAATSAAGRELFRSDGSAAGTFLVADLAPGPASSSPRSLLPLGSMLVFSAEATPGNAELWATPGSGSGTRMIEVNTTGSADSAPWLFAPLGGEMYWLATGAREELWRSDGTPAGTAAVLPVEPLSPTLATAAGRLFFLERDPVAGPHLVASDGTRTGTARIHDFGAGGPLEPRQLTAASTRVYFYGPDGEPWMSDGTTTGTSRLLDIHPGTFDSRLGWLGTLGDRLFLRADDGSTGVELWTSEGTGPTTSLVADLLPGSASAYPWNLRSAAGWTWFGAIDPSGPRSVWRSDGTAAGTLRVKPSCPDSVSCQFTRVEGFVEAAGAVYFTAADAGLQTRLWLSDGTPAGTAAIVPALDGFRDPGELAVLDGIVYFLASSPLTGRAELWRSDGTSVGTFRVKDVRTAGSGPGTIAAAGGRLFFTADDAVHGLELWRSDGTEAGTQMVSDLVPGAAGSQPRDLIGLGSELYFSADDGIHGREPWALSCLPLTLLEAPRDTVACVGGELRLSSRAGGDPDAAYQWLRDGVELPGATAPDWIVPVVSRSDAGSYSVRVSGCSVLESPTALVAVLEPPDPVLDATEQRVCRGGQAALAATLKGDPPVHLQWERDGAELPGATSPTYRVDAAQPSDQGEYRLRATSPCGVFRSAALRLAVDGVLERPVAGLMLARQASELVARWEPRDAGAQAELLGSSTKDLAVPAVLGRSAGSPSLRLALPPGALIYLRVRGENACGSGPL